MPDWRFPPARICGFTAQEYSLHDLIGFCPYIYSPILSGEYGLCGCKERHGAQESAIGGICYGQPSVSERFLFLCLCALLLVSLFLQLVILLHGFGLQNRKGCLRCGVQPVYIDVQYNGIL